MSVVGIDFGNQSLLIAQAAKGGIDVILNESSHRQTPTFVSIQGKQRFFGDAAAALARSNVQNTISCAKLLVGRKYDEPDVQREISKAPFICCKLEHGGVGIQVSYNDEKIAISAEHFLAMVLVKAKEIAKKANNNIGIGDAVLAVPFWYTESQRRGILNSCEIADLHCLEVVNESTAIATSYGIYKSAKKLFSETEPTYIMFIDIGYSCYSVTIVSFIQEKLQVLATVCDRELGGRDFDDVITEMMAEVFEQKTKINVRGNVKAMLKMQAAAEKAKKTLSPNGVSEANVSVECLADDRDLSCVITKDEFEARAATLLARLSAPVEKALSDAGLSKEQISEVEIVGGGSRVNSVKRTLGQILGLDPTALNYGLKTTMNSDEAVARGTALQCAMLSSRVKVKPFNVLDKLPYDVSLTYESGQTTRSEGKDDDEDEEEPAAESTKISGNSCEVVLFPRGELVPRTPKRITFLNKSASFRVGLQYAAASQPFLPPGQDPQLSSYLVKIPPEYEGKSNKVRLTFVIDKNFLVVLSSAVLMDPIPTPSPSPETKEGEATEAGKKKYKRVDLQVEASAFSLTKEQLKAAIVQESMMQSEDELIVETGFRRNELESYIYTVRDKLNGAYKNFSSDTERSQLSAQLAGAEDWLYNEGYEGTKLVYIRKLDELKVLGNKIESRLFESENRSQACDQLRRQVELCRTFAGLDDDEHAHITDEERGTVRREADAAESWLFDELNKQSGLKQSDDPTLTVEAINKRRQTLFSTTNPITAKPKPKPVESKSGKEESKSEKDEAKSGKGEEKGSKEDKGGPMDQDVPAAEGKDDSVPMDQA